MGKKKLFVWLSGQKSRMQRNQSIPDGKYSIKEFSKEHAATMEDSDIPELIRKESDDEDGGFYFSGKSGLKPFKPFLFASISAIIIGSVLGVFMLNLFVDINQGMSQQNDPVPVADNKDEDNEANKSGKDKTASSMAIKPTTAYVLQAGKFGEKANADEMAKTFSQAGFSAIVWEKGDYFFTLSGIAETENQGTQLANEMTDKGLEVYVKEWSSPASEIQLSKSEKQWVQAYQAQWKDTLAAVSNGGRISAEKWKEIVNGTPKETEHIANFTAFLEEKYQQMGQADKRQSQMLLLNLWKQFNHLVVD
ncbi:SPOR domain-containing protein [Lentibacillus cibarius]|uniref:SPOR domain-containing protein n=1 Tax=Lentibacillus cibarius TaxID=2583219 RepID=A0A549YLS0_9BACI|nr:SPOR domain-containing protein [Lentibacillus cibarius]TRM12835.1 SPOR domain-containing protein [Lentibacillus cibarius]